MAWVDQADVGLTTFNFSNFNLNSTGRDPWVSDFYDLETIARIGKLPGHDLNTQNSKGKRVQLVSVNRGLP